MAFNYRPHTEAEIKSFTLMTKGIYTFEVIEVHETDQYGHPLVDKNQNAMFKVRLKLWDQEGRERYLFDFFSSADSMAWKLRHYCSTIGLLDDYDAGKFKPVDALNCNGKCEVIIRPARPKNDGSGDFWPESNSVKDYIKSDKDIVLQSQAKVDTNFVDDDIPDLR